MKTRILINIIIVCLIFISGCATITTVEEKSATVADMNIIESITDDYEIECKVKIKSPSLNQSGKCSIVVTSDQRLKFSLYHPLGGAILINYMDAKNIQHLNRNEKMFIQMENNPKNRNNIFMKIADLNVADFTEILWGRKVKALDNDIVFDWKNKKISAVKEGKGGNLEIVYLKWFISQGVRLPKLISLKNKKNGSYIKIAVTKSTIGKVKNDKELALLNNCTIVL